MVSAWHQIDDNKPRKSITTKGKVKSPPMDYAVRVERLLNTLKEGWSLGIACRKAGWTNAQFTSVKKSDPSLLSAIESIMVSR